MTLFDEAELASVFGQNVLYTAAKVTLSGVAAPTGAAAVGVALYENWRSPIPRDASTMNQTPGEAGQKNRPTKASNPIQLPKKEPNSVHDQKNSPTITVKLDNSL